MASSSAVEDPGRAFVHQHLFGHRRLLDHPAVGGQVALEDGDAALGVIGVGQGPDDFGVQDLHRRQILGHGLAGDGHGAPDRPGRASSKRLHHRRDAAGQVQVLQMVAAARAHGAEVRSAAG